jgi:hypothetical protein
MVERRGTNMVLVGIHEEKKPLQRPRGRRDNNIKMYRQDVGWKAWAGLIWLTIGRGGGLL